MSTTINLLPWREAARQTRKKHFYILAGSSIGTALFIVLIMHLFTSSHLDAQIERNRYLQREITKLDETIAEVNALEAQKKKLLARMQVIHGLQHNRPTVVQVFDGLTRAMPPGLHLNHFMREGQQFTLIGEAGSNSQVSQLMRQLTLADWIEKPVLREIQANREEHPRKIAFHLNAIQVTLGVDNELE